jgi:hypothetical protein
VRVALVERGPGNGVLSIRRAIVQFGGKLQEKDTKTHQQRRVTLDPETVAVLAEHFERAAERAASIGAALLPGTFVFSNAPDCRTPLVPGSVSQRYSRMAGRLGIDTHLHALRHYSATELISAGVDARTVAGRLGHRGGGNTTLRVYAAWVAESDQRAARGLVSRLPQRPAVRTATERALEQPRTPRERLAVELREQIVSGQVRRATISRGSSRSPPNTASRSRPCTGRSSSVTSTGPSPVSRWRPIPTTALSSTRCCAGRCGDLG